LGFLGKYYDNSILFITALHQVPIGIEAPGTINATINGTIGAIGIEAHATNPIGAIGIEAHVTNPAGTRGREPQVRTLAQRDIERPQMMSKQGRAEPLDTAPDPDLKITRHLNQATGQSDLQQTSEYLPKPDSVTDQTKLRILQSGTTQKSETDQRSMDPPWKIQAKMQSSQKLVKIEDINEYKILYWNCCKGLSSKLSILKSLIIQNKPQFVFVCEAEIKINKDFDYYNIDGYALILSNTIDTGMARLACYVKNGIKYNRRTDLEKKGLEIIILDSKKVRIIGLYRPFKMLNGESTIENFDRIMSTLKGSVESNNGKDYICGGDFNVNWLMESQMKNELVKWMDDGNLLQKINQITRYRVINKDGEQKDEKPLLDHIYLNEEIFKSAKVLQLPTAWSNHEVQIVTLPTKDTCLTKKRKVMMREWKRYNPKIFIDTLELEKPKTLTEVAIILRNTLEKYLPKRVVRFREDKGQVTNTKLAKLVKKRDRLIKSYKISNDKMSICNAHQISKRIKKMARASEKEKIRAKLKSPDTKSFWTTIKSLLGRKSNDDNHLIKDGQIIRDQNKISNMFVEFFVSKVKGLEEKGNPDPNLNTPLTYTEDVRPFTVDEIKKSLRNKKCYGLDGIPLKIVKDIARQKPDLILDAMNMVLVNGLPQFMKVSRIIPLHKKGAKTDIANYRPVANLSSLGKLYEKIILARLQHETEGKEGDFQRGYRKHHSTTSAILDLQNKIAKQIEAGELVAVYSMDLSAAFDVLRPRIALNLLKEQQVSDSILRCLEDFL